MSIFVKILDFASLDQFTLKIKKNIVSYIMVAVSDRQWSTGYLISNCQSVYRKTDENIILEGTSELHKQTSTSCFLSTMYGNVFSTDTLSIQKI